MWTRLFLVISLVVLSGCTARLSTFSMRQADMNQVRIGDTTDQVRQKLGAPKQIITEAEDREGQPLAVTWVYDAQAMAERGVVGNIQPDPHRPVSIDSTQQTQNVGGTTYHILFVDGQVSQILER